MKNSLKKSLPDYFEPMLATLNQNVPEGIDWIYELKWDGYRALSYINNGNVEIRSRNNKSFNEKFYPVFETLKKLNLNVVLDGEIVVVDKYGAPDFGALQLWRSEADGLLRYYVFDILFFNGENLLSTPLKQRREFLIDALPQNEMLRLSDFFTDGMKLLESAKKLKLEGIMAKKLSSIYLPGKRTKDWLKIKTEQRQEFVIGGYTKNKNSSKLFSALLMGAYNNGRLEFVTPVGTGFKQKEQEILLEKMNALKVDVCPFSTVPEYNKPSRFRPNPPEAEVVWIKPELVAEISFREQTKDYGIRHPSFKGLREDKKAKNVHREYADDVDKSASFLKAENKEVERKTLLNPANESQTREINGHLLKFSNLSKIYWPDEKVSKRDMLNYYYQMAPYILPYIQNRPQTLNRFPNGIDGKSFYQKDIKGKAPEWLKRFPYHSETDGRDKEFLVAGNEASLLYIASLGCIEINPWSSTVKKPDYPDWCIIDLDPDKNDFKQVVETALVTNKILDAIGVDHYCKTSGSTGLHIYIPLGAKYSYEDSKEFGRAIARQVNKELPGFTSIERKTAFRKGKIYIDFLQNRPQATVACAYSLRPKPGAPVSMPLLWDEVTPKRSILDFTIFNAYDIVQEKGDVFNPVLGKGINLDKALKKFKSVFEK